MSHRTRHSSERERDRDRDYDRDRDCDRDRSHRSHHKKDRHRRRRHHSRHRDRHHSRKTSRRDRSRDRSSDRYSDRSSDRSHDRSRDRSRDRSGDRNRDRSRERSRDHNRDRSRDRSVDSKKLNHGSIEHREIPETHVTHNFMEPHQVANMVQTAGPISQHTNDDQQAHASQSTNDFTAIDEPAMDNATETYAANDPDAFDPVLEEEKERIQRETYARLQQYLVTEGKSYPAPKPQASHPIFANDGSFLETFKSLQGQMQQQQQEVAPVPEVVKPKEIIPAKEPVRMPPTIKRRGGKILKTGVVRKQRIVEDADDPESQPKDSWSAYLKEVKRYKNVTCSEENMTRSLVK